MTTIKPFANDADSVEIAGMTVENGTDKIAVYGNLDITYDKAGLAAARKLKALVNAVVATLEADKSLPDQVKPQKAADEVENPFG
ncbi:hypothetical protein ACHMW5_02475 [Azospirillum melinis]|uniref:hypothetical protein n=1 Tax=Azospirillum melinis TaxID=328839 RepID=UPI00375720A9